MVLSRRYFFKKMWETKNKIKTTFPWLNGICDDKLLLIHISRKVFQTKKIKKGTFMSMFPLNFILYFPVFFKHKYVLSLMWIRFAEIISRHLLPFIYIYFFVFWFSQTILEFQNPHFKSFNSQYRILNYLPPRVATNMKSQTINTMYM